MNSNLTRFYDRLASFDTETTGLNVSKDNIWQLGFTSSSSSIESEVNPFLIYDHKKSKWTNSRRFLKTDDYVKALRTINGEFSEASYRSGAFNKNIRSFSKKSLKNINEGFINTIGNIKESDILVMQNHKFENRLLLDKRIKNLIDEDNYNRVKDRFQFVSTKDEGLFNTPPKVQSALRDAEFKKYTRLDGNININKLDIRTYTQSMNKVIDEYKAAISNSSKAIVVEQMDITKALYANAIDKGFMRAENNSIGLSIDFLTRSLYNTKEKHTALSDSKDTLKVFKDSWKMIEELRSGNITKETKENLKKIVDNQEFEKTTQFNKTVSSVLNDFKTRGTTSVGFHRSTNELIDTTSNIVHTVNSVSVGSDRYTSNFNDAMDKIALRFNSKDKIDYIDNLKNMYNNNNTFESINNTHNLSISLGREQFNSTTKLGEESTKIIDTSNKIPRSLKIGLAIGAGLLYMGMKDSPKIEDKNTYASQDFYDEQYLGTVFFESENRNKHYMY